MAEKLTEAQRRVLRRLKRPVPSRWLAFKELILIEWAEWGLMARGLVHQRVCRFRPWWPLPFYINDVAFLATPAGRAALKENEDDA